MPRMRSFFFHYNKPASQRAGKQKISVHFKNQCLIVDNVVIDVPTRGHLRKSQPRFVMKGKCNDVVLVDNVAVIQ